MRFRSISYTVVVTFLFYGLMASAQQVASQDATVKAGSSPLQDSSSSTVPRLMKFSGTLLDSQNRPMPGTVGVTFAIYSQESGGAALWMETQNVHPDANGNYTVLLGEASKDGLPTEEFTSGEARWLGLQVENQTEGPRVLLVSVPYALKAHDAETLGGLPASAFLPAVSPGATGGTAISPSTAATTAISPSTAAKTAQASGANLPTPCAFNGSGVANFIPIWTGACSQANSLLFQTTAGKVGLSTTTPSFKLHVIDSSNAGLRVQTNTAGGTVASFGGNGAFQVDAPGVVGGRLTITSNGLVGLGTNAPGAMLDVTAPNSINDPVAQFGNSFDSSNSILVHNKFCPFTLCLPQALITGTTTMFISGGANTFMPGTVAGDGGLRVIPSRSIFFGDSGHSRMVVLSNGNVGINNPSPTNKLTVTGDGVAGATAIVGNAPLSAIPGTGVSGTAGVDGTGVAGSVSVPGGCGSLELCSATGVSGRATGSAFNVGVSGSVSGGGIGVQGFSDTSSGFGVQGNAPNAGVQGVATTAAFFAAGVWGNATATTGLTRGVYGTSSSSSGIGVHGIAATGGQFETGSGNEIVGRGFGHTNFRVDATGKVFADGGFQTGGADFAESFAVRGERQRYEPGDLLVIDRDATRKIAMSQNAYSKLVAGIYSTKPGLLGTPHTLSDPEIDQEIPLAVVGVVPCKVSTENGVIAVGDLLVSSNTPGYAMKGTNRNRMLGAVVGKALEPLQGGKGKILVLVTLQ